jgi:hypothetical protein
MSRILLTGMTSSHTSDLTNKRSLGYAGILYGVLTDAGHNVLWDNPEIGWDDNYLDTFDSVLCGISPLGSLTANRVYGALNVIDAMYDSHKLTLFFDAPEPSLIATSLRSVYTKPENLTKDLYSKRKFFNEATEPEHAARLYSAVQRLVEDQWPITLYPDLPWKQADFMPSMPSGLQDRLLGMNLDAHILERDSDDSLDRSNHWVTDSVSSPWVSKTAQGLIRTITPLVSGISKTDDIVRAQLLGSSGALVSPYKRSGTWWTPLYAHAMNTTTPVATEWRESSNIGPAWNLLASQIEAMSPAERNEVARVQRGSYLDNIMTAGQSSLLLETEILRGSLKENWND